MGTEHVTRWNEKLVEMKANRHGPHGRVVRRMDLEDELVVEMEGLFSAMTKEERASIERPETPTYPSLIAHNDKGQLIGLEDDEETYEVPGFGGG